MKRLIAFPLVFAAFFGPMSTMPTNDNGTVAAATISVETPMTAAEAIRQEEHDEATEDTPWLIVLPLAFAIPLAVLLVPAFFGKRRGGGH
ncbi:MAG TPA: hypothetical protein VMR52_06270 [Dehalococcoidia bacterium]|nr:hypothetical protein [Dehalococcoidia bacterium]